MNEKELKQILDLRNKLMWWYLTGKSWIRRDYETNRKEST